MSTLHAEASTPQTEVVNGQQFDRHLLSSPAATSSSSTSPLDPADDKPPPSTPTPTSSPASHPVPIGRVSGHSSLTAIHPTLPCPQARLLHSWWRWPSYITLSWLTPLLLLGARRTLRHSDLWDTYPTEHAAECWQRFEPLWQRATDEGKAKGEAPRLMPALRAMIGWQLLLASLVYAWVPTDQLLGPQFLNQLVKYSVDVTYETGVSSWQGYKYTRSAHSRHRIRHLAVWHL